MPKYHCKICRREFSTSHGLTQHCNAKHRGRTTLSQTQTSQRIHHQRSQPIPRPEHDDNLWNTPITMPMPLESTSIFVENPVSQADNVEMEDVISVISEDNTNLKIVSEVESRLEFRTGQVKSGDLSG